MDEQVKRLIDISTSRGSRYVKGEGGLDDLPEKFVEFGVLVLSKSETVKGLSGEKLRTELSDVQSKLDDLRKNIFYAKFPKKTT